MAARRLRLGALADAAAAGRSGELTALHSRNVAWAHPSREAVSEDSPGRCAGWPVTGFGASRPGQRSGGRKLATLDSDQCRAKRRELGPVRFRRPASLASGLFGLVNCVYSVLTVGLRNVTA